MKPTNPQRHILETLADGHIILVTAPEHYEWVSGHTISRTTMNSMIRNGWVEMTVGGRLGAGCVAYKITNTGRDACDRTPLCNSCGKAETLSWFNDTLYGRGWQMLCNECWELAHDHEQQLLMDDISNQPVPSGIAASEL